jgi:hypothetical protein
MRKLRAYRPVPEPQEDVLFHSMHDRRIELETSARMGNNDEDLTRQRRLCEKRENSFVDLCTSWKWFVERLRLPSYLLELRPRLHELSCRKIDGEPVFFREALFQTPIAVGTESSAAVNCHHSYCAWKGGQDVELAEPTGKAQPRHVLGLFTSAKATAAATAPAYCRQCIWAALPPLVTIFGAYCGRL